MQEGRYTKINRGTYRNTATERLKDRGNAGAYIHTDRDIYTDTQTQPRTDSNTQLGRHREIQDTNRQTERHAGTEAYRTRARQAETHTQNISETKRQKTCRHREINSQTEKCRRIETLAKRA